eukprot:TRINITY_DN9069_c0_g1_i2.p1 TRINITY_DN9069_c0_g1~~TRINITY_DN9069_c0_g1_i2.p1  ORF type:complete len:306 (+),score=45.20 TRINITY_DN9069_c0_g1_i2:80-919(+)
MGAVPPVDISSRRRIATLPSAAARLPRVRCAAASCPPGCTAAAGPAAGVALLPPLSIPLAAPAQPPASPAAPPRSPSALSVRTRGPAPRPPALAAAVEAAVFPPVAAAVRQPPSAAARVAAAAQPGGPAARQPPGLEAAGAAHLPRRPAPAEDAAAAGEEQRRSASLVILNVVVCHSFRTECKPWKAPADTALHILGREVGAGITLSMRSGSGYVITTHLGNVFTTDEHGDLTLAQLGLTDGLVCVERARLTRSSKTAKPHGPAVMRELLAGRLSVEGL